MKALKPSELTMSIEVGYRSRRPMFIKGVPGVGKSDIVRQTAKRLGVEIRDVRAILLDPVDLRGLPHVNGDGRTHWAVPEFLPRTGKGILFLDELNAAPPLVQAACYQLILDRKLGEYTLPDGWVVMAAGNGDMDGAVTSRMGTALRSRFVQIEMTTDFEDWYRWATNNDVHPAVIAFIRYRTQLLHQFDKNQIAFPCPRTWHFVSDLIKTGLPTAIEFAMVEGTVGTGAATEFFAFLQFYRDCPDIDKIIANPKSSAIPAKPGVKFAVACALALRANAKNMTAVITYLDRMDKEYCIMAATDIVTRDETLQDVPAFTNWAIANHTLIMG